MKAKLLSIDETIALLQKAKESGVPGTALTGFPATDNNSRLGFVQLVEGVVMTPVAQADIDKGYNLCKKVSRGGVVVAMFC